MRYFIVMRDIRWYRVEIITCFLFGFLLIRCRLVMTICP